MLGQPSDTLTLRQLVLMVRAKRRDAWEHTSSILALIANVNRDPATRATPFTPADFDPFAEQKPKGRHGNMDSEVARLIAEALIGKPTQRPPGRWERFSQHLSKQESTQ